MSQLLEGVKVLDYSRYIGGPYCAKLLADMGADVVRVDDPGGAEDRKLGPFSPSGEPLMALALSCNKRDITLNLNCQEGKAILERLLKWSDILVESFSVPAKKALGLTYPAIGKINKNLILVSISGYGLSGPLADYPCYDSIAQAESGLISVTGYPSTPVRSGISIVDFCTGLHAAFGSALALLHRKKTGIAQMVDISLFDVAFSLLTSYGIIPEYNIRGEVRPPLGLRCTCCYSGGFKAKDGWVYISATGNGIWKRLCSVLGRKNWIYNPEFRDDYHRFVNHTLIDTVVEAWVGKRNVDEVVDILHQSRVTCGRINSIPEVIKHPQVNIREDIVELEYPGIGKFPFPGVVTKFSETPGAITRRAPQVGEHNEEFYCEALGFSSEEFHEFKRKRVI